MPNKDERIAYTHVSKPGGIDGLSKDQGGVVMKAFWTRLEAEKDSNAPYHEVVPIIIDMDAVTAEALATLTPVQKLVLGLPKPKLSRLEEPHFMRR